MSDDADPTMSEQHPPPAEGFCPQCGSRVAGADQFCRACGTSLTDEGAVADHRRAAESPTVAAGPAENGRSRRRIGVWVAVLGVVIAMLGAGTLVALTVLSDDEPSEQERASGQAAADRKRLEAPFNALMKQRDQFFAAERRVLSAMDDAKQTIKSYQKQARAVAEQNQQIETANSAQWDACLEDVYNEVPCPNPDYPDAPTVPDLSSSVKQLRSAAKRLDGLHAELLSMRPPGELKVLHEQLTHATQRLSEDATFNADTMTEAVTLPEDPNSGDSGMIDQQKIKTLRGENALPTIRQMNDAAVAIIRRLDLPLDSYDVPNGNDIDDSDHSTAAGKGRN